MAKLTTSDLTSLTSNEASAVSTINSNFAVTETAMEKTLSRDGTTPNEMEADLDMDSNDILNVGTIHAEAVLIDGNPIDGSPGVSVLDDLTDVTISTVAGGDVLRYNGSLWVNYPDSNYADAVHAHDDLYYTEAEVDALVAATAPATVDYLVKTATGSLSAERVVGDSSSIKAVWDVSGAVTFELIGETEEPVTTSTDYEESVLIATDATDGNITLSGEQTLQGVALVAGDRVLVTAQSTAANNRVWVVASGAWTIASGWDVADTVTSGRIVPVEAGDNTGKLFFLSTTDPIVLGTTALTWIVTTTAISNFTPVNQTTATVNLTLSMAKSWIFARRGGAQTINIPTNASHAFPTGTEIIIQKTGSGTKTIQGATAGVSVNGVGGGSVTLVNDYDAVWLKKQAANAWFIVRMVSATSSTGVSDGDKGDITVSSSGTVWTVDNAAITTAKLGGDITTAGKALLDDADATAQRTTLGLAIGTNVQAYDADTLKADTTANLTAGFTSTAYNAGTKSSGTFTPDPANGNLQRAVNGGAHTLAPPSVGSGDALTMVVQYTNNGSAGAVTTSGFTKVDGSFTTTNADDFICYIAVINGFSHLNIVALQ